MLCTKTLGIVCMSSVYWWRQLLHHFIHCMFYLLIFFLFMQHQFFLCVSLSCSWTRNKSFPLSALPWSLNWTWIILTPSSHWSQSSWPRTIRKWQGHTKSALSSFGSLPSISFCFVLFVFGVQKRNVSHSGVASSRMKNVLNNSIKNSSD